MSEQQQDEHVPVAGKLAEFKQLPDYTPPGGGETMKVYELGIQTVTEKLSGKWYTKKESPVYAIGTPMVAQWNATKKKFRYVKSEAEEADYLAKRQSGGGGKKWGGKGSGNWVQEDKGPSMCLSFAKDMLIGIMQNPQSAPAKWIEWLQTHLTPGDALVALAEIQLKWWRENEKAAPAPQTTATETTPGANPPNPAGAPKNPNPAPPPVPPTAAPMRPDQKLAIEGLMKNPLVIQGAEPTVLAKIAEVIQKGAPTEAKAQATIEALSAILEEQSKRTDDLPF